MRTRNEKEMLIAEADRLERIAKKILDTGKYRTCRVDKCDDLVQSNNYCAAHYKLYLKYNTPTPEKICQGGCGKTFSL